MAGFFFATTLRSAASRATLLTLSLGVGGCGITLPGLDDEAVAHRAAATVRAAESLSAQLREHAPARDDCEVVPVFAYGGPAGAICVDDVEREGLTMIDLSDTWTPRVFAPVAKAAPGYRAEYLRLAAQPNADLGLHGVSPNFSLVASRLVNEKRQACDAGVDLTAIAAADPKKRSQPKDTVLAIQSELVCAGWMQKRHVTGYLGGSTRRALDAFRRRHMIVGRALDAETLHALGLGGEELAFRELLRGLRERVADATGLIEDGSALEQPETVLERQLDLSRFAPRTVEALENGAPDLVSRATHHAARELGWTTPDAVRAFVRAQHDELSKLRVAVALAPPPAYHSSAMDLRVEIDRGDVYYDAPGVAAAARKKSGESRPPTFVVYAKDGDRELALVRWATTIGGWKKERLEEGDIALKYKGSDVGERMWRHLVAAPAWLPPDSTPETDLVYEGRDGAPILKRSLMMPGYRNAFGLAMLIHHESVERDGETKWLDRGIRTHGSVNYGSIANGTSHGCHRLYNQLVLRLTGFLLEHRAHTAHGKMRAGYQRTLAWNEESIDIEIPTRGFLYELDPPVPVRVLEGRIAGRAQKPVATIYLPPVENEPTT